MRLGKQNCGTRHHRQKGKAILSLRTINGASSCFEASERAKDALGDGQRNSLQRDHGPSTEIG